MEAKELVRQSAVLAGEPVDQFVAGQILAWIEQELALCSFPEMSDEMRERMLGATLTFITPLI